MLHPTNCKSIIGLFAGVLFVAGSAANAQETAQPSEFEALKSCRAIVEDSERLACFDSAMGVVVAAEESGELRVIDQEATQQTRRRLFGFTLPNIGLFGDGNGGDYNELDMLETTITSVRQTNRNGWIFRTEEGAIWEIKRAPTRLRPLEAGQSVIFKKASFGSYFIRIEGQMGVKGTRVS